MRFKSYTDIENSYNKKYIDQIYEYNFDHFDIEWVAEIKIDGSNLQCSIDSENNFIIGTRNKFLNEGESFQGYERAMKNENVEECLRKMKVWIKDNYSSMFDTVKNDKFGIRVYGELCGGFYRHPDVEKIKGAVKIQGRVSYHPDNVWIPFDIDLIDEEGETIFVFSQTGVHSLCTLVGLPHPIIIKHGTFEELLNLPNTFPDPTGKILFGLPLIDDNITEGLVLKPNLPLYFDNGKRVMLKNKNEKFKEKSKKVPKEAKEIIPMNELEKTYYEHMREYITESRLMSVFSKVGQINQKAFGMILGMYLKDLNEDFNKEYGGEVENLENTLAKEDFDLSKVRKELSKEVQEFIRPIFIQHL